MPIMFLHYFEKHKTGGDCYGQQQFHWGGGGKTTPLFYVLENSVKKLLVHKYAHTALSIYIYIYIYIFMKPVS